MDQHGTNPVTSSDIPSKIACQPPFSKILLCIRRDAIQRVQMATRIQNRGPHKLGSS